MIDKRTSIIEKVFKTQVIEANTYNSKSQKSIHYILSYKAARQHIIHDAYLKLLYCYYYHYCYIKNQTYENSVRSVFVEDNLIINLINQYAFIDVIQFREFLFHFIVHAVVVKLAL